MAYVKLDKDILTSSLWVGSDVALVFITALLLAEPRELMEPAAELETDDLKETGFLVPPGWYGFVPASSDGIIGHARMTEERGMEALRRLASVDRRSRSQEYGGRRMVRINNGFVVLNYIRYREKDHSAAERMRRYRDRKKKAAAPASEEKPPRTPRRQSKVQQSAQVGLFIPPKD
jgi:hypothetical protein